MMMGGWILGFSMSHLIVEKISKLHCRKFSTIDFISIVLDSIGFVEQTKRYKQCIKDFR